MKKRIAVVGIGGVGGYIGFYLADHYKDNDQCEIIFIQREGKHFDKLKKIGLTFETNNHSCSVRPNLMTHDTSNTGIFDLVIFCTKSTSLEDAAKSLNGNVNDNTVFLSTLNGVNTTERLKKIYPRNTIIDGCIYVASYMVTPGVISLKSKRPKFFIGNINENSMVEQEVEKILQNAGINVILSDNIVYEIWEKYIFVCSLASITSLYNIPLGGTFEDKEILSLWINLMKEEVQLAQKESVNIDDSIIQKHIDRAKRQAYDIKTSMQLDIERNKPTEINIFTGYVVKRGKELRLPVPNHEFVYNELLKSKITLQN